MDPRLMVITERHLNLGPLRQIGRQRRCLQQLAPANARAAQHDARPAGEVLDLQNHRCRAIGIFGVAGIEQMKRLQPRGIANEREIRLHRVRGQRRTGLKAQPVRNRRPFRKRGREVVREGGLSFA